MLWILQNQFFFSWGAVFLTEQMGIIVYIYLTPRIIDSYARKYLSSVKNTWRGNLWLKNIFNLYLPKDKWLMYYLGYLGNPRQADTEVVWPT